MLVTEVIITPLNSNWESVGIDQHATGGKNCKNALADFLKGNKDVTARIKLRTETGAEICLAHQDDEIYIVSLKK